MDLLTFSWSNLFVSLETVLSICSESVLWAFEAHQTAEIFGSKQENVKLYAQSRRVQSR